MKFKKQFGITALCIMVFNISCDTTNAIVNHNVNDKRVTINGLMIETYIIDSCEYIGYMKGSKTVFLTHKGNCKFCIERQKRIIK